MTDRPDVRTLLAELGPLPKQRSEKWAKVEKYLGDIYAAKDRGAPWAIIAETLSVAGIDVKPVDLRVFVSKIDRDYDKYPKIEPDVIPKKKAIKKIGKVSRKTVVRKDGGNRSVNPSVGDNEKPPVRNGDASDVKPDETQRRSSGVDHIEHAAQRNAGRER